MKKPSSSGSSASADGCDDARYLCGEARRRRAEVDPGQILVKKVLKGTGSGAYAFKTHVCGVPPLTGVDVGYVSVHRTLKV